jgi:hypothetical protein
MALRSFLYLIVLVVMATTLQVSMIFNFFKGNFMLSFGCFKFCQSQKYGFTIKFFIFNY